MLGAAALAVVVLDPEEDAAGASREPPHVDRVGEVTEVEAAGRGGREASCARRSGAAGRQPDPRSNRLRIQPPSRAGRFRRPVVLAAGAAARAPPPRGPARRRSGGGRSRGGPPAGSVPVGHRDAQQDLALALAVPDRAPADRRLLVADGARQLGALVQQPNDPPIELVDLRPAAARARASPARRTHDRRSGLAAPSLVVQGSERHRGSPPRRARRSIRARCPRGSSRIGTARASRGPSGAPRRMAARRRAARRARDDRGVGQPAGVHDRGVEVALVQPVDQARPRGSTGGRHRSARDRAPCGRCARGSGPASPIRTSPARASRGGSGSGPGGRARASRATPEPLATDMTPPSQSGLRSPPPRPRVRAPSGTSTSIV